MPLEAVGRLRGQAPVKPLTMALSAAGNGIDEAQGGAAPAAQTQPGACRTKEFSE